MQRLLMALLSVCFISTAIAYDIVGPYSTGINPVSFDLPADIGIRKNVDHGADPLGLDYWGRPYDRLCIYGHSAQQRAEALLATTATRKPELVGWFDPKSGDTLQNCYKALPRQMDNALVLIMPGVYQDAAAKPMWAGNKNRTGSLTISGELGQPRPVFNYLPKRGAFRFVGLDRVVLAHLQTQGIGISHDAGNIAILGVSQTGFKGDGIYIGDADHAWYESRKEYIKHNEWQKVTHHIYDWESWGVGQGNAYHPVYAQCRNRCFVHFDHVLSYAANDSHAIKAPVHQVAVTNSILSAVAKIDKKEFDARRFGTKLFDGSASGLSFIDNVLFIAASGTMGHRYVSAEPIYYSPRRAIYSGDYPFSYGSPEYMAQETWQTWRQKEYLLQSSLSPYNHHIIGRIGVHRISLANLGGEDVDAPVIENAGTWPRDKLQKFSPISIYFDLGELNDIWIELSRTHVHRVVRNEFAFTKLFEGSKNGLAYAGNDAEGNALTEAAPHYIPDRQVYTLIDLANVPAYWQHLITN